MNKNLSVKAAIVILTLVVANLLMGEKTFAQAAKPLPPSVTLSVIDNPYPMFHLEWNEVQGAVYQIYRFEYYYRWELIAEVNQASFDYLWTCGRDEYMVVAVVDGQSSGLKNSTPVSGYIPCGETAPQLAKLEWSNPTTSSVTLHWSAIEGTAEYQVMQIQLHVWDSPVEFASTSQTSITLSLPCGTAMLLNVRGNAVDKQTEEWMTNQVRVETLACEATTLLPTPLPTVDPRIYTTGQYDSVTLFWDQMANVALYNIWHSDQPDGNYHLIAQLSKYETQYKDVVGCGQPTYYYMTATFIDGQVSEPGKRTSVMTYPCLKRAEVKVALDSKGATLDWTYDSNAQHYVVEQMNVDQTTTSLATLGFKEHTVRIMIPCGEVWHVMVAPVAYGKSGPPQVVELSALCNQMMFPLVGQSSIQR